MRGNLEIDKVRYRQSWPYLEPACSGATCLPASMREASRGTLDKVARRLPSISQQHATIPCCEALGTMHLLQRGAAGRLTLHIREIAAGESMFDRDCFEDDVDVVYQLLLLLVMTPDRWHHAAKGRTH